MIQHDSMSAVQANDIYYDASDCQLPEGIVNERPSYEPYEQLLGRRRVSAEWHSQCGTLVPAPSLGGHASSDFETKYAQPSQQYNSLSLASDAQNEPRRHIRGRWGSNDYTSMGRDLSGTAGNIGAHDDVMHTHNALWQAVDFDQYSLSSQDGPENGDKVHSPFHLLPDPGFPSRVKAQAVDPTHWGTYHRVGQASDPFPTPTQWQVPNPHTKRCLSCGIVQTINQYGQAQEHYPQFSDPTSRGYCRNHMLLPVNQAQSAAEVTTIAHTALERQHVMQDAARLGLDVSPPKKQHARPAVQQQRSKRFETIHANAMQQKQQAQQVQMQQGEQHWTRTLHQPDMYQHQRSVQQPQQQLNYPYHHHPQHQHQPHQDQQHLEPQQTQNNAQAYWARAQQRVHEPLQQHLPQHQHLDYQQINLSHHDNRQLRSPQHQAGRLLSRLHIRRRHFQPSGRDLASELESMGYPSGHDY